MALGTAQHTLSTTASSVAVAHPKGSVVKVKNLDAAILVYVGDAGVTATTGYRIDAGGELTLEYPGVSEPLFAVAASGTPKVSVLRVVKN